MKVLVPNTLLMAGEHIITIESSYDEHERRTTLVALSNKGQMFLATYWDGQNTYPTWQTMSLPPNCEVLS